MSLCELRLVVDLFVRARVDAELLVAADHALMHVVAAECVKLHFVVSQLFLNLFELLHLLFSLLSDLALPDVAAQPALAWLDPAAYALGLAARSLQGRLSAALACLLAL